MLNSFEEQKAKVASPPLGAAVKTHTKFLYRLPAQMR